MGLYPVRPMFELAAVKAAVAMREDSFNKHDFRVAALPDMSGFLDIQRAISPAPHLVSWRKKTPLYHLPSPIPHAKSSLVSADASAVVLAFGGSGTGISGVNMVRLATSMAPYRASLVSMDHPYHGLGERTLSLVGAKQYFDRLREVIDELCGVGLPTFLLGHSFGAIAVQEILMRDLGKFAGAIMVSPAGFQSPALLQYYLDFRNSPRWQKFSADHGIAWDRVAEVWAEGLFGDGGVGGQFTSVRDTSKVATTTPVLFVRGENDPWSSTPLVEELAGRFARSEVLVIPNAGHVEVLTVKDGSRTRLTKVFAEFAAKNDVMLALGARIQNDQMFLIALRDRSKLFTEWVNENGVDLNAAIHDPTAAKQVRQEWTLHFNNHVIPELAKKRFELESPLLEAICRGARENPVRATPWRGRKVETREVVNVSLAGEDISLWDSLTRGSVEKAIKEIERLVGHPNDKLSESENQTLMRYVDKGIEIKMPSGRKVLNISETTQAVGGI